MKTFIFLTRIATEEERNLQSRFFLSFCENLYILVSCQWYISKVSPQWWVAGAEGPGVREGGGGGGGEKQAWDDEWMHFNTRHTFILRTSMYIVHLNFYHVFCWKKISPLSFQKGCFFFFVLSKLWNIVRDFQRFFSAKVWSKIFISLLTCSLLPRSHPFRLLLLQLPSFLLRLRRRLGEDAERVRHWGITNGVFSRKKSREIKMVLFCFLFCSKLIRLHYNFLRG